MATRSPHLLILAATTWLRVRCGPYCPQVACSDYVTPARWTGRVAILVTGFIRTATLTSASLRAIQAHNPDLEVEVYYHVWYNASARCDTVALENISRWANGISFEPIECSWSWGSAGFKNHWHGVYNAFRALSVVFRKRPTDYGLIMRTGTDVSHASLDFFNFTRIWATYSVSYDQFFVLGYANGFDRTAIATPAVMRAYSLYGHDEGYGCDSQLDSFPFQRMRRFGITFPLDWTDLPAGMQPATKAPRCGAFFVSKEGLFKGALRRPRPGFGCPEYGHERHLAAHSNRRRLAIRPPDNFVKAEHAYCSKRQFDRYIPTTAGFASLAGSRLRSGDQHFSLRRPDRAAAQTTTQQVSRQS